MVIIKPTKMKVIIYFLVGTLLLTGCSIDNYEGPTLTLSGQIIDAGNNQLVESGGVNAGTIVKLYENNSTQPLLYKTFPEGNFINRAVFPGNYTYTAEGPFRLSSTNPLSVVITSNTEIQIRVIPYLRLKASVVEVTGTTAKIKIEYEKVNNEDVLANLALIHSTFPNPNTFSSVGGAVMMENVEANNLTSGEKIYTISGLKQGTKYYIRAGGNVINPGNFYNYSSQLEIDVP